MKTSKAFWEAFWSGLAAPGMLIAAETPRISRIEPVQTSRQSDMDAMRSDWIAIGKDFKRAIEAQESSPS